VAVNLPPPEADALLPIAGLDLGVARAGIKKPGRKDLLVMRVAPGAASAGVFTQNRFCAAPVILAKRRIGEVRALVVNTGNANAGTGTDGLKRADEVCRGVAKRLDCRTDQVLPFSTGVIMEPLPVERIVAGLDEAIGDLKGANWLSAAEAIMTTDTVPKAISRKVKLAGGEATITGIAKGAGMIRPDMATMLAFVATDAAVKRADLQRMTKRAADRSFNAVTVDGDTSTNDAFVCLATGKGPVARSGKDLKALETATIDVSQQLAQSIIRDGEGATKFVTVRIEQGKSEAECRKVAYAIAHSPLVKTAFFASDPNLGRILAAIGNSGIAGLNTNRIDVWLDDVLIAKSGGRFSGYREEQGAAVMKKAEFLVRAVLRRGRAAATIWTCDFSYDYVKINAEYRT